MRLNGLRTCREAAGLAMSDIAKYLGVDPSAVSMWESGTNMPRADRLPDLAQLLHCTIDELFGRDIAAS